MKLLWVKSMGIVQKHCWLDRVRLFTGRRNNEPSYHVKRRVGMNGIDADLIDRRRDERSDNPKHVALYIDCLAPYGLNFMPSNGLHGARRGVLKQHLDGIVRHPGALQVPQPK